MNVRLKRTPGLYLVGFMGSGKTSIGRHLAHRLGWSFFDLDHEIESAEKTTVADLIDERGEAEFRRIESQMLRQHVGMIERGRPTVLALGGGSFADPVNRQLILGNGIAIWLDCPFDRVQPRYAALFESRQEIHGLADVRIGIEHTDADDVIEAILNQPILK